MRLPRASSSTTACWRSREQDTFFDSPLGSLTVIGESLSAESALVWGPVQQGTALAGFAGGRIGRVRATTLAVEAIGHVPGDPRWVGKIAPNGHTVVVYEVRVEPSPDGPRWARQSQRIRILETGMDISLGEVSPSAYFLDSRGHLWLGEDRGEWGGSVSVIELAHCGSGVSTVNAPKHFSGVYPFDGIYGFTEIESGVVLVYGGTSHMGLSESFVAELSFGGALQRLFLGEMSLGRHPNIKPDRPTGPVSHVLRADADRFVVISYNDVFATNRKFTTWKRLSQVSARYQDRWPSHRLGTRRSRTRHCRHARGQRRILPGALMIGVCANLTREVFLTYDAARHRGDPKRTCFSRVRVPRSAIPLPRALGFPGISKRTLPYATNSTTAPPALDPTPVEPPHLRW